MSRFSSWEAEQPPWKWKARRGKLSFTCKGFTLQPKQHRRHLYVLLGLLMYENISKKVGLGSNWGDFDRTGGGVGMGIGQGHSAQLLDRSQARQGKGRRQEGKS